MSILMCTTWICNIVATSSFLPLSTAIGPWVFLIFAIITTACFVFFILLRTRNKRLAIYVVSVFFSCCARWVCFTDRVYSLGCTYRMTARRLSVTTTIRRQTVLTVDDDYSRGSNDSERNHTEVSTEDALRGLDATFLTIAGLSCDRFSYSCIYLPRVSTTTRNVPTAI